MASTRQIKSRIRSVRSTKQITKAMELVASSKMRRAQEATAASRMYAEAASELLTYLADLTDVKRTDFYKPRTIKTHLVILITSDRGLAGAYNANVLKQFSSIVRSDAEKNIATKVLCVGRKGAQFVSKVKGVETIGVYQGLPEHLTARDVRPILTTTVQLFLAGEVDAVDIVTTHFVNSLVQNAVKLQLLPAGFDQSNEVPAYIKIATFEPSVETVLNGATMRLLEAQLFQAVLDANASEQSMRRVAMKNATENAGEIIDDLTLEMNKVRQAAITQELAEIAGGAEAMK
jgi:F-type H+-transporting ATPase subunit gamma